MRSFRLTAPKLSEQELHRCAVKYLRLLEARGRLTFFHPANGGFRTPAEAAMFKAMGVRRGVADLIVYTPAGVLELELKSEGGTLTDAQAERSAIVGKFGVLWFCCRSLDEIQQALESVGTRTA